MSRTTLCVLTAAALAALSITVMVVRRQVMGEGVGRPIGPGRWKVTMTVEGKSLGKARLMTATPLEMDRQHVLENHYGSAQMSNKPPEARHPERRQVLWSQRAGVADGPFRARCEFQIAMEVSRQHALPARPAAGAYGPPRPGQYLHPEKLIESNHERVSATARARTADLENGAGAFDAAEKLYQFVRKEVKNGPRPDGPEVGAAACLGAGKGDRAAKARLLTALLRNRNIPARIVRGLPLKQKIEERGHYWVEAWVNDRWLPMCPYYQHFDRVPSTYLILGFGDRPLVQGRHVKDLRTVFQADEIKPPDPNAALSPLQRLFAAVSLYMLPPAEKRLVEVLLLLPIAALIICLFRNVIGLTSFGTFAPALIGLAFHDFHEEPFHLPAGIGVFVSILLVGWLMRRVLDRYHLLQVPRVSIMLTLIMGVLIAAVVAANQYGLGTTTYISLFPLIILTGMVERFWTLETEDSTQASFKTLVQTMFIAAVIALALRPEVAEHMRAYPETLGLVMAAQLLIGRYTGYRLMELLRFRDFLRTPPDPHPWAIGGGR